MRHAADEADGVGLGHEAGDDAREGAVLLEVDLDALDVLEGLVVGEVDRGIGVGQEGTCTSGLRLGGLGDDVDPGGAELVARSR